MVQSPRFVKLHGVDPVETNPVVALAAAVGFSDPTIERLRRILTSHKATPPAWLPDRALAARIQAENVARSRLMRHLELAEGVL